MMKNYIHHIKELYSSSNNFSNKIGISDARLEKIISQTDAPSYSELLAMAKLLDLPISYLISEKSTKHEQYRVLFRKKFNSPEYNTIASKFQFLIDNFFELNPNIANVENIRNILNPVDNTYENAEALAFFFREYYFEGNQLEPLNDLPQILSDKLGFYIKVVELGNSADGASLSSEGFIFIFLSPRFEGRMLFTVAHELGHILNHHGSDDFFYFDENIVFKPTNDPHKLEFFANAFASCLLLPEKGIALMIKRFREYQHIELNSPISDIEILYISRFFGVSFDVAAQRFESIKLIPKGGAYSLSKKIKDQFQSAEKRADELGLPPRNHIDFPPAPSFILKKAIELIESGQHSIGKIAEMLSISVNDILNYHSKIE